MELLSRVPQALEKKKKGDSTSQLELGVGLVGIMQAGTWEFEVS